MHHLMFTNSNVVNAQEGGKIGKILNSGDIIIDL
jgi:hypothetical protein